jgi:hypothetical protein
MILPYPAQDMRSAQMALWSATQHGAQPNTTDSFRAQRLAAAPPGAPPSDDQSPTMTALTSLDHLQGVNKNKKPVVMFSPAGDILVLWRFPCSIGVLGGGAARSGESEESKMKSGGQQSSSPNLYFGKLNTKNKFLMHGYETKKIDQILQSRLQHCAHSQTRIRCKMSV